MLSRLRTFIAIGGALMVTILSLGRVRVNWSGRPAALDGAEDPARAAVTRSNR